MLYNIAKALVSPLIRFLFRPKVEGLENFPAEGKTIVYANHTSMWDPVVLGCLLPRQIFFMAKVELFQNPFLGWILKQLGVFPVKRGTADLSAIKNSLQVLKEGKVFGIFPEGSRNKSGKIKKFSHGVASIAHRSKATIVPVAIIGDYRLFRPITVRIGTPLDFTEYFSQKSNTELLEKMTNEMVEGIKRLLEKD